MTDEVQSLSEVDLTPEVVKASVAKVEEPV